MRRPLNIPAILLSALAMGVWVGASFHVSSQPLTYSQSGATCQTCCNLIASLSKQSKKTRISNSSAVERSECAACLAGALVQTTPDSGQFTAFELSIPSDTTMCIEGVRIASNIHSLPLGRGPPA